MKHTVSEQALNLVEKQVKKLGGRLSPEDAAAATGLIVSEAQDALSRMLELYVTRVSYNDEGRIIFDFDLPLRQRGEKTLAEKWASLREKIWRAFKVFYKIWIAVMLILYFAVMAVLVLLLIVAASSSSRDDDRRSGGGENMLGGLMRALSEGLRFAFLTHAYSGGYGIDTHGYRYREARVPHGVGKKKNEKSFIISIYDFALGPERAEVDPLENEREAAEFLRQEKGILTSAEVLALSGGDFPLAEERMADYLARFGGEPRITDEGVVVGEFDDFILRSSNLKTGGDIVHFWDEYEAPYQLTGNPSGRNFVVGFMAAFTLFAGVLLGPGGGLSSLGYAYHPFFNSGLAYVLLGIMPIIFGLSYLLLPLLRWPFVKKQEAERMKRNRKKQLMRAIFLNELWRTTAEGLYLTLPSKTREELTRNDVDAILGMLTQDLQGEIQLADDGTPVYTFERLRREYEAAAKGRGRIGSR